MTNTKNFLLCLFHQYFQTNEGFIEYRILKGPSGASKCVDGKFCTSIEDATSDKTYAWLTTHNQHGADLYFGVLPRFRKDKDDDSVKHVTSLWADLDKKDFGGDKQHALNTLLSFPIKPSAIVDSGNGYHGYWFLECEAITDRNIPPGIMKGMAKHLHGDHTHNLSRILRLPGTLNWKGLDNSLPCSLMDEHFHPENIYELSEFEKYWTETEVIKKMPYIGNISETMPERFRPLLVKNKKLSDTWYGRAIMPNNSTRSAYDMSLAVQLKNLYFTETEIAAIMRHSPSGKGLEATPQYLAHTIGKAVLW